MMRFVMTDKQLEALLDACKPVPYMVIGGIAPRSPQENANDAWEKLGLEMGFDSTTVEPGPNKKTFFAEPPRGGA